MRILQLSTFDTQFGAAIAARRLHLALRSRGRESDLLVGEARSGAPRTYSAYQGMEKLEARARHYLDRVPLKLYSRQRSLPFSANWMPSGIHRRIEALQPDVVHLHWCESNFVPTGTLPRLKFPLVWTFHDMWAFTGGCHYDGGCGRYLQQCGRCPVLQSSNPADLSHWLWKQKHSAYRRLARSMRVICPSHWMANLARNAPLLEGVPVHAIPNPISTETFRPVDQRVARRLLGLPEKGNLLLMGAAATKDPRKGFDLLVSALRHYAAQPGAEPLGLVTLGTDNAMAGVEAKGLTTWSLGFLQDEASLCALYNAVDLVALPSREENLSNVLAEALCCGTPCVAFRIGGNGDLVTHQGNGYLAQADDIADMAAGIDWTLRNLGAERTAIAQAASAKVSYEALVPEFMKVYEAACAPA